MKIFACFIKQARFLLAIISKMGGGGDNSILWLSFAQQKQYENLLLININWGKRLARNYIPHIPERLFINLCKAYHKFIK
jgi:hypothetical protein